MKPHTLLAPILSIVLANLLSNGALAAASEVSIADLAPSAETLQAHPEAVIQVSTFNTNVVSDGQCSLIEAITNANDDATTYSDCTGGAGPDTIVLQAGIYALDTVHHAHNGNNGLPPITSEVTIAGNGATVTRATGDGTGAVLPMRIFHVLAGGNLTLDDLTISGGIASEGWGGGAIRNDSGTVTLNNCLVAYNLARHGDGGGILNMGGVLHVTRSMFRANQAFNGGGIFNQNGHVTVDWSEINLNSAAGGETAVRGGGLASRADGSSTAILSINHSVLASNEVDAPDGSGGGVAAWSTGDGVTVLALNDTLVWANLASHGGGLWIAGSQRGATGAAISRSAVVGNRASGYGSEQGSGAGIGSFAATTVIANSTIAENAAAGTAGSSGGGIDNASAPGLPPATMRLINATVASNSALTGGGIANRQLGAGALATVATANTIVAANAAPQGNNCWTSGGGMTSLGHNLEDVNTCGFDQSDDLPNTDPLLDLLADNGGPTPTYALPADSPAVDAADDAVCADLPIGRVDQRGIARPQGAACDIGAFELRDIPTFVALTDLQASSPVGTAPQSVHWFLVCLAALLVIRWCHILRRGARPSQHHRRPIPHHLASPR